MTICTRRSPADSSHGTFFATRSLPVLTVPTERTRFRRTEQSLPFVEITTRSHPPDQHPQTPIPSTLVEPLLYSHSHGSYDGNQVLHEQKKTFICGDFEPAIFLPAVLIGYLVIGVTSTPSTKTNHTCEKQSVLLHKGQCRRVLRLLRLLQ